MTNENLETLVKQRKSEALDKNLFRKAFDIAQTLGKESQLLSINSFSRNGLGIHFSGSAKLDCKLMNKLDKRFFESFRYFNLDLLIRYNKEIVFKAEYSDENEKEAKINITSYIPGEDTWEKQLSRLYSEAISKDKKRREIENAQRESYLKRAFAL